MVLKMMFFISLKSILKKKQNNTLIVQIIVPFFGTPPSPQNRILFQNGTIIGSRVLKEFPIKWIIFWVPPPPLQTACFFKTVR